MIASDVEHEPVVLVMLESAIAAYLSKGDWALLKKKLFRHGLYMSKYKNSMYVTFYHLILSKRDRIIPDQLYSLFCMF